MTTTLTHPEPGIRPAVTAILDRISVSPDGTRALIDGRPVRDRSHPTGTAPRTTAESALELRKQLAGAAYEVLHAGRPADAPDPPYHARDLAFEDRLRRAVPHPVRTARLPVVTSDPTTMVVLRDGVRVRLPRPAPVAPDEPPRGPVGEVVDVEVPSHRAQLSPGFFVVDGTRTPDPTGPLLRVYVHLTRAEGAAAIWADTLSLLQDREVRYRAKVLSSPALYPRHDALVVYLDHRDRRHVAALAERVAGRWGVGTASPAFARSVGQGVGIAWEPADPRPEYAGLSFGQHRAHVLVDALFEARDGDRPLADVIAERFAVANIDPLLPSRNADSPPDPVT